MSGAIRDYAFCLNRLAEPSATYGTEEAAILNDTAFENAWRVIASWPGYAPTPLMSLPGIAKKAGVGALCFKDEAPRFGLGSFKALGGAYAVWQVLRRKAAEQGVAPEDGAGISAVASDTTVCCATDGNHGRSVAWGAASFGCSCVIFIHANVSEARKREIEKYGASVVRVAGNYDDSVRLAQQTADLEGWVVVSDTSYEGYAEIPKDVMQGYEIMAAEALGQWPFGKPPTHVFLQTGVGGMAAAVVAHCWRRLAQRPVAVLADPLKSACWLASIQAGKPTAVTGDLDTVMAGLACGEVSDLAWTVLRRSADAVIGLPDEAAVEGMRLLAESRYGDRPIVAGESAVTGLMALLAIAGDTEARAALRLDGSSRVLVFGTEGATDPELYRQLVGRDPAEIDAAAGAISK